MKHKATSKKWWIVGVLATVVIAIAVVASIFILSGSTQPEGPVQLLENPGFETGDITGFRKYGHTSTMQIASQYAHSGQYGLLLSDRTYYGATYAQLVEKILTENGPGTYRASVWVKLKEGVSSKADGQIVIEFQQKSGKKAQAYASESIQLTDTWQELVFEGTLDFDPADGFQYAYLYHRSYDSTFVAPDVCIDDFSLVKLSEVNGVAYQNTKAVDKNRTETSTVGAIRWDAWYTHDGVSDSTITQVERSLSPAQFHFRAPFYAKVTDEGKIIIPEYNQEIFDREMQYARDAGIDYFAYVWYKDEKANARKYHVTSQYNKDVKMAACFHELSICDDITRSEMEIHLTQDYYMTVLDGRPLMYFFVKNTNIASVREDIVYYRALAVKLGIPDPYIVVMNVSTTALETVKMGADAISNYSVAGGGNMPFTGLMDKAFHFWEEYRQIGAEYVPIVSSGWQTEPRFINPVSWQVIKENSWAQYPTPQQITEHLTYALAYLNHPDVKAQTGANTCIMYAWNEFDEGGWICPTIAVDEKGNQLYGADGAPLVNTERIEAVKQAVANYKSGNLPDVILGGNGASSGEAGETITS